MQLGSFKFIHPCYIVESTVTNPYKGILGLDILNKFNLNISFEDKKFELPRGEELRFHRGPIVQYQISQVDKRHRHRKNKNDKSQLNTDTYKHGNSRKTSRNRETLPDCKKEFHGPRQKFNIQQNNLPVRMPRSRTIPPQSEVIITARVGNKHLLKPGSTGVIEPTLANAPENIGALHLNKS